MLPHGAKEAQERVLADTKLKNRLNLLVGIEVRTTASSGRNLGPAGAKDVLHLSLGASN